MIPHGNQDPDDWADAFTDQLDDKFYAYRGLRIALTERRAVYANAREFFTAALRTGAIACDSGEVDNERLEEENQRLREALESQKELSRQYEALTQAYERLCAKLPILSVRHPG